MSSRPSPRVLPEDRQLADAHTVFQIEHAARVLRSLFGDTVSGGGRSEPALRYLEYEPGVSALARWRVDVGGTLEECVIAVGESARPYVSDTNVLCARLRDDPALALLRRNKYPVLAWVPLNRAVLHGSDDTIVKVFASSEDLDLAVRNLDSCRDVLPVPHVLSVDPIAQSFAQSRVGGSALDNEHALDTAEAAVAMLQRLHGSSLIGLPVVAPVDLLDKCDRVARLVRFALPELEARIAAVVDVLRSSMPTTTDVVPSHGDFTIGQMLNDCGTIRVVDTDTLCVAPRALDLSTYAANGISGRTGDEAQANAIAIALQKLYPVEHAEWFLAVAILRRLDRAIRRMKRDWPERTIRVLTTVENAVVAI